MAVDMAGMIGSFKHLTPQEQRQAATEVLRAMALSDARVAAADAGIGTPSQGISDRLWTIVVSALAVIDVIAVIGLVVTLFVKAQGSTSADLVLTIFTTTTAGLIGLFVPSPAQGKAGQ